MRDFCARLPKALSYILRDWFLMMQRPKTPTIELLMTFFFIIQHMFSMNQNHPNLAMSWLYAVAISLNRCAEPLNRPAFIGGQESP
jgi:hypothetical protein